MTLAIALITVLIMTPMMTPIMPLSTALGSSRAIEVNIDSEKMITCG